MHHQLEEAFGFRPNQVVQMLVPATGSNDEDNEITLDPGTLAIIASIADLGGTQGIAFTVAIGGKITNVFDQGDGMPDRKFFEPVTAQEPEGTKFLVLSDLEDPELYIKAARQHAEDSGEPDHEVGNLQDLFRAAMRMMTDEQKIELLFQEEVQAVLGSGGFNIDL
ncbi:hypothetical protein [Microvirga tunisiensis]|uniref:hypothetical protein n=1 Tax=Microvirga tunisiensis TaxID=2108360 RepID=UPI00128D6C5E|nr:hypothetical protein [Microvirga tunisiensis]MPR09850.1 hypothetical protein [Microvirga tunisiensis]